MKSDHILDRLAGLPSRVLAVGLAVGCFGFSGPVLAVLCLAYGLAAARLFDESQTNRINRRRRVAAVDAVAGLAADLRAGAAPGPALATAAEPLGLSPHGIFPDDLTHIDCRVRAPIAKQVAGCCKVASTTGAPLAEILDRLDAELRAFDRARELADSHAAGAKASIGILVALPLAGIGLGVSLGVDPLRLLLHTPAGAACSAAALVLQGLGILWSNRLASVRVEQVTP